MKQSRFADAEDFQIVRQPACCEFVIDPFLCAVPARQLNLTRCLHLGSAGVVAAEVHHHADVVEDVRPDHADDEWGRDSRPNRAQAQRSAST